MRVLFLVIVVFFSINIFAQKYIEAEDLFNSKRYSAAQSLYADIISSGDGNEEIEYFHAKCSKELSFSDAIFLYTQYLDNYPYSLFLDQAYEDLGMLFFQEKDYSRAIEYFKKISDIETRNQLLFKIGYSYFCIDSHSQAASYFSKLIDIDSKYTVPSRYYFAFIAYKKGFYKNALNHFEKLKEEEQFKRIVPYYISQIYFLQKEFRLLISFLEEHINNIIPSRAAETNRILAEAYYRTGEYQKAIIYFNNYLNNQDQFEPISYFLLGMSYFKILDYENAIVQLEKVTNISDSIAQYSAYYLGASYLSLDYPRYALQAFKKSSEYKYNRMLQEEAFYNYAKLSYQIELPFNNTLEVLNTYLEMFDNPLYRKEIEGLMIETLKGTSQYLQAYSALDTLKSLSLTQKYSFQQLTFFLGVEAYNTLNYQKAIEYFQKSNIFPVNMSIYYLSSFWLADCFYKIDDKENAIKIYSNLPVVDNNDLAYYQQLQKYNLGYCYFDQKQYKLSNKYFRKYEKIAFDSIHLHDTYLRIADGFFMQKEYALSDKYYQKAIQFNLFDVDYAIYNRSIISGLLGKDRLKIELLNKLKNNYESSIYYPDALYMLAEYYQNESKYDIALQYYNQLLEISNSQEIIAKSIINKAMIYFNMDDVENSIQEFVFVVDSFPNTSYFTQALAGLKTVYISLAQIEDYLKIIEELPEISISSGAQDSLMYNTAFMKFSEEDYVLASISFDKYLTKFENGIFYNDALYYNGISAVNLGDTALAVNMYSRIVESKFSMEYKENALMFLARRAYKLKDFKQSNKYYSLLEEGASNNFLKRESIIRLMFGYTNESNDLAYQYANKVLMLEKIDDWLISKANIILARKEFEIGNYVKASKMFEDIDKLSKYSEGAEAKYHLAYLAYLDDSLSLSEKMIFEISEEYSDNYFIAKAFLLLADIYILQDHIFQAKATLESIIDNYNGDELVNMARKKREKILKNEISKKNAIEDYPYIDISEEFDYEFRFDNDTTHDINIQHKEFPN